MLPGQSNVTAARELSGPFQAPGQADTRSATGAVSELRCEICSTSGERRIMGTAGFSSPQFFWECLNGCNCLFVSHFSLCEKVEVVALKRHQKN